MSKFYVVATPIGNLEDITLRARSVLESVDLILCEDTRETKKILGRYEINKPVLSYHARSSLSKIDEILNLVAQGKTLALVSDAGTPGISDPGSELVSKIREKYPEVEVLAIPGPSALTAFVSIAGLHTSQFLFLGFLPHKKGRQTLFKEIGGLERAVIFYESPHRILKTLESLVTALEPQRRIAIGRELTKVFEQVIRGTSVELLKYFKDNPDKVRGEFVVIVDSRDGK